MKNMKNKVLLFLGMGSCVSAPGDQRSVNPEDSNLAAVKWSEIPAKTSEKPKQAAVTLQALVFDAPGSKDDVFFDSKPWLESDDEDFLSVNGDYSPQHNQMNSNIDHRKLSELFRDSSSFSSDSQTSEKAKKEAMGSDHKAETPKYDKKKAGKTGQRCLPSLVRSLSCGGDWKRRQNPPAQVSAAG